MLPLSQRARSARPPPPPPPVPLPKRPLPRPLPMPPLPVPGPGMLVAPARHRAALPGDRSGRNGRRHRQPDLGRRGDDLGGRVPEVGRRSGALGILGLGLAGLLLDVGPRRLGGRRRGLLLGDVEHLEGVGDGGRRPVAEAGQESIADQGMDQADHARGFQAIPVFGFKTQHHRRALGDGSYSARGTAITMGYITETCLRRRARYARRYRARR